MNGSTVTFDNSGNLVSWDLVDDLEPLTLTPGNSITGATFDTDYPGVDFGNYPPGAFDFYASANDWSFHILENSGSTIVNYFEIGDSSGAGSIFDQAGDPGGTWTLVPVPDASSTFQLLMGALAVLGACKYFLRDRAAVLV